MEQASKTTEATIRELEFAIFCIEEIARKTGAETTKVYDLLTKNSKLLYDYVLPNYEVLHSQDREYIVNDILEVMHAKGLKI